MYLIVLHEIPSHSDALDHGKSHFYEENGIRYIAFNFNVTSYKILMDLTNLSPRISRNAAMANFTSIYDNEDDESFKS